MADISGRRDRNKKSPAVHYDMHRCTRRCDLHCFAAERSRRLIGRAWKNLRSKIFLGATTSSRLRFPSDTTTGQVFRLISISRRRTGDLCRRCVDSDSVNIRRATGDALKRVHKIFISQSTVQQLRRVDCELDKRVRLRCESQRFTRRFFPFPDEALQEEKGSILAA